MFRVKQISMKESLLLLFFAALSCVKRKSCKDQGKSKKNIPYIGNIRCDLPLFYVVAWFETERGTMYASSQELEPFQRSIPLTNVELLEENQKWRIQLFELHLFGAPQTAAPKQHESEIYLFLLGGSSDYWFEKNIR